MSVSQQKEHRENSEVKKACDAEMIDESNKCEKAEIVIDTTSEKNRD
jgi:hypothetical protein